MDIHTSDATVAAGPAGPQPTSQPNVLSFSNLFPTIGDQFDAAARERMVTVAREALAQYKDSTGNHFCRVEKIGTRGGVFWVLPRLQLANETILRIIAGTGIDQSQVRTTVSKVKLDDGTIASLLFASTGGIEDGTLSSIKSQVDAAAPYLVGSVLDFKGPHDLDARTASVGVQHSPATVRLIEQARLCLTECQPEEERAAEEIKGIQELLTWLQKQGFIFHGARSRNGEDGGVWRESGILNFKGEEVQRIKERLDAMSEISSPTAPILTCRRLPLHSPIHEARPLVALSLKFPDETGGVKEFEFVGLWSTQALADPNINRKILKNIKSGLDKAMSQVHADFPNARLVSDRVFNTMPKDLALRLKGEDLAEIMKMSFDAFSRQSTSLRFIPDPSSAGLVVCMCLPGQRDEPHLQRKIRSFLAQQFEVDPLLCEIRGTGNEGQITNFYAYVPTINRHETLDQSYLELLEGQIRQLCMSWTERAHAHAQAQGVPAPLAQSWVPVLDQAYQRLDPLQAALRVPFLDQVAQDGNIRVSFDDSNNMSVFFRDKVPDDATLSKVFEKFGLSTTSIATYTHGPLHSNGAGAHSVIERRFALNIPPDSARPLEWLNADLAQALEKALPNKVISDNLDALMLSTGINAEQVRVVRAFAMFRNSIDKYQARGGGKRIFNGGYSDIVEAVTRNPWAVEHFFKMFEALHSLKSTEPDKEFARLKMEFSADQMSRRVGARDRLALNALVDMQDAVVRTNFYSEFRKGDVAIAFNARKFPQMQPQSPFLARMDVVIGEDYIACHDREGLPQETEIMAPARGGMRMLDLKDGDFGELHDLCFDQGDKNYIWRIPEVGGKSMTLIHGFLDPMSKNSDPKDSLAQRERVACAFMNALWDITDNLDENMQPVTCPGIRRRDGQWDLIREMGPDMNTSDLPDAIILESIRRKRWEGSACMSSSAQNGYSHPITGITSNGAFMSKMINLRANGWNPAQEEGGLPIYVTVNGGPNGDVTGNTMEITLERVHGGVVVCGANKDWVIVNPDGLDQEELMRLKKEGKDWGDFALQKLGAFGILSKRANPSVDLSPEQRARLRLPADAVVSGEDLIRHCMSNNIGTFAADGSTRKGISVFSTGGRTYYIVGNGETAESIGESYNQHCWATSDQAASAFDVIVQVANRQITDKAASEMALRGTSIRRGAGVNGGGVRLSSEEVQLEKLPLELALRNGALTSRDDLVAHLRERQDHHVNRTLQVAYENEMLFKSNITTLTRRTDLVISVIEELVAKGILSPTAHLFPSPDELRLRQAKGQGVTAYELDFLIPALTRLVLQEVHSRRELVESTVAEPLYLEEFEQGTFKLCEKEILQSPFKKFNTAAELAYEVVSNMGFTGVHKLQRDYDVPLLRAIKCSIAAELLLGTRHLRKAIYNADEKAKFGLSHEEVIEEFTEMSVAHEHLSAWLVRHQGWRSLGEIQEHFAGSYAAFRSDPRKVLVGDDLRRFEIDCEAATGRGLSKIEAERLSLLRYTEDVFDIMYIMRKTGRTLREAVHAYSIVKSEVGMKKLAEFLNKTEPNDANEAQDLQKAHDKIRDVVIDLTKATLSGRPKHAETEEPSETWVNDLRNRIQVSDSVKAIRVFLSGLEQARNAANVAGHSLLDMALRLETATEPI